MCLNSYLSLSVATILKIMCLHFWKCPASSSSYIFRLQQLLLGNRSHSHMHINIYVKTSFNIQLTDCVI